MSGTAGFVTIDGGCHCGAVRFTAQCEAAPELLDCNCSICSATGFLHLIVPHDRFILLSGGKDLAAYRFGTGKAEHLFCRNCGIKSFYQPRSHPDCWSVHFACIADASALTPTITKFDGRNWEQSAAAKGL